jgi:hypothetical protein
MLRRVETAAMGGESISMDIDVRSKARELRLLGLFLFARGQGARSITH